MTASPVREAPAGQISPLQPPRPCAPTPSPLPRADGRNTFSYLPAAKDHTLRAALLIHPPAVGEGKRAPLLFPGAGRSVWGHDKQEMPRSRGS